MEWQLILLGLAELALLPFVFVLGLRWIWAPIMVHRSEGLAIAPRWEGTQLEHMTPEMQELVGARVREFGQYGFAVVANVRHADGFPGTRGLQVLLVNRETGDVGRIVVVHADVQRKGVRVQSRNIALGVASHFADGRTLGTGSAQNAGVFPKDPLEDSVNVAWVRDAGTLCEMHRRRLAWRRLQDVGRIAPESGRAMEYVQGEWTRELERVVRCGWFFRDESRGRYRYTWKGAALSVWKLNPPVKGWWWRGRMKKARREWLALKMDGWEQARREALTFETIPEGSGVVAQLPEPAIAKDEQETAGLDYSASVRDGEVRIQTAGDRVVAHVGNPTRLQYLARQPFQIAIAIFVTGMASHSLWRYWNARATLRRLGASYLSVPFPSFVWLCLAWCAIVGVTLVLSLRRLRGVTVLVASRVGLSFQNAPGRPHTGTLTRDSINTVMVGPVAFGGKRRHGLHVNTNESSERRYLLATSTDLDAIERLQNAMLQGLGMISDAQRASAAATEMTNN